MQDNESVRSQASSPEGNEESELAGSVKVETTVKAGVLFPISAINNLSTINVRYFSGISSVLVR
jgi:hypothetical protein